MNTPGGPVPRQVRGLRASAAAGAPGHATCPHWCTVEHGRQLGEEDHLHLSDAVFAAGTTTRLCTTIDPDTGSQDGPYVMVGEETYTLVEAAALGAVLQGALELARERATRPGAS